MVVCVDVRAACQEGCAISSSVLVCVDVCVHLVLASVVCDMHIYMCVVFVYICVCVYLD